MTLYRLSVPGSQQHTGIHNLLSRAWQPAHWDTLQPDPYTGDWDLPPGFRNCEEDMRMSTVHPFFFFFFFLITLEPRVE